MPSLRKIGLSNYILELDGLRAIAIVSVMLFHLSVPGFALGWAGVNLFFVISGFLITGILLDTKNQKLYFRNFYVRRALRIFPIYYLSVVVIVIWAKLSDQSVRDLPYFLLYLQNFVYGLYLNKANFPYLFAHSWSLAIEEQFYIFWPLVIFFLTPRRLLLVLVCLFMLGPISRIVIFAASNNPFLTNRLLPSQIDCLCAGALLALLLRQHWLSNSIIAKASIVIACIVTLLSIGLVVRTGYSEYYDFTYLRDEQLNLFLTSNLAILFACLLAIVLLFETPVSYFLRMDFLRHIGKISYGLYLYHFPIYFVVDAVTAQSPFAQLQFPGFIVIGIKLLATYIVSILSWKIIESRILALKDRFGARIDESQKMDVVSIVGACVE